MKNDSNRREQKRKKNKVLKKIKQENEKDEKKRGSGLAAHDAYCFCAWLQLDPVNI